MNTAEHTNEDSSDFETRLQELYARYRHAECSFGYLAEALGITTWELAPLLEERGWVPHNLPS
jgi:hypothetical protein